MSETTIITIIFLLYLLVREYLSRRPATPPVPPVKTDNAPKQPANQIMKEEENEIAFDDPDFDIRKVNKVFIDGQERDVEIK